MSTSAMMSSRRSGLPLCSRADKVVVEYSARKDSPYNSLIKHLNTGEKDIVTLTTARGLLIEKMEMGDGSYVPLSKLLVSLEDGESVGIASTPDEKQFLRGFVAKYSKSFCLKGFAALNSYVYHRSKQIIKTRFIKWKYLSFEHSHRLKSSVFHSWRSCISRLVMQRLNGASFIRKVRPCIPLYRRSKFRYAWMRWQQHLYGLRCRVKARLLFNVLKFYTNQSRNESTDKLSIVSFKHQSLFTKRSYNLWKLVIERKRVLIKALSNEKLQKRRAFVCFAGILYSSIGSYSKSRQDDLNKSAFPLDYSSSSSRGEGLTTLPVTPPRYKHHIDCSCVTCLRIKSSASNRSAAKISANRSIGTYSTSASTPYDSRSPARNVKSGGKSIGKSTITTSPTSVKNHPMTPERQMSTPSRVSYVPRLPRNADADNDRDCSNDDDDAAEGRPNSSVAPIHASRVPAIGIKRPLANASVLEKFQYRIKLAKAASEGLRVVNL